MNREPIFNAVRAMLKRGFTPEEVKSLDLAIEAAGGALLPPAINSTYDRAVMVAELRRDEGERLKAYKDTVGKWTIGVGRNLDDVGIRPEETRLLGITASSARANGITSAQSAALLESDLDEVDAALDKALPWWRTLNPARQRVMVNMAFNLGIRGLLGFQNTLNMIESGDYEGASKNMLLSKWARQVGERANRLSVMMRSGR